MTRVRLSPIGKRLRTYTTIAMMRMISSKEIPGLERCLPVKRFFSSCVCCQKCHWAASCCFWFWSLGNSKLIFLFLPNVKSIWCKMCALSFNCRNTRTCEIHHHEVHLSARHSMSGIGKRNHALLLIRCPGQLNRWPWYWLTHSLSEWLTFWFQSH